MYCPSCGSEERQLSQYCRACGTDLRVVRTSLERPDAITASAVSAREHIGLAIADQIRQMRTGKDLEHIAEDVLPSFEKFLESPEERRLRRLRAGDHIVRRFCPRDDLFFGGDEDGRYLHDATWLNHVHGRTRYRH